MSFDLAIFHTRKRLTDAEADDLYGQLCDGNVEGVEPSPNINAFYAEITAKHPEIDDVPEERIGDIELCPWSIAFDRSPGHLILCCVWAKAEYVESLVKSLAAKYRLSVYDPQLESVIQPAFDT